MPAMAADTIEIVVVTPYTNSTASSAAVAPPFSVGPGLIDSGYSGWPRVQLSGRAPTAPAESELLRVRNLFSDVGVSLEPYRDILLETGHDERPEYVDENRARDEQLMKELGPARGKVNREVIR